MNKPLAFEDSEAFRILTLGREAMAHRYASAIETGRRVDWRRLNALLAASLGWPKVNEIKQAAHLVLIARHPALARTLEETRVYSRQVVPIPCGVKGCDQAIRPGGWAFWGGAEIGMICETCAVMRAAERML